MTGQNKTNLPRGRNEREENMNLETKLVEPISKYLLVLRPPFDVIPVQTGIQCFGTFLDTRFGVARLTAIAGMTGYWRTINFEIGSKYLPS